ncbi:SMP-30/gluconolactonase/LRE family protein [Massilia sp. W12]|uniref:SMP-30/gluconolactonase/LRE family protein n=1 Tax=Massilia sp. W12 TaxID=3126507 RepID=UPI0030D5E9AB
MSKQITCEIAFDEVMQVGESPLWSAREQSLYWVDIPAATVHRLRWPSRRHSSWKMPSDAASIALAARGGLIVATRNAFIHLNTENGEQTAICDTPYDTATMRVNDGKVDARGRFWVGTMYEPRDKQDAMMLCLERGQLRTVWQGGATVSNGLAFGPVAMYQADTTSHQIRRFGFNVDAGQVGPGEVWLQFPQDKTQNYGGRPDGAAIDANGNYWCAMFEGGRLLCIGGNAQILHEIQLPVRCPTMLAFGGPDLRTLFVTSASRGRSAQELADYPASGKLLALNLDVAGIPEPFYLD